MYNDILKIGSLSIHGYGLMIGIGVIVALVVAAKRAKKSGLDTDFVYGLGLVTLVFGFIGAKLLYCIVEIEPFLNEPMRVLSGSGFVLYGGIIGGILTAMIYCKHKKVDFFAYFDLAAPSVTRTGFGRWVLSCWLLFGRETDSAIGVMFHNSSIAPNGVKLIPTQLFSSAGDFLIAIVLLLYARKDPKTGKVGALYLVFYSMGRFIIEFFRSDYRGNVGVLSTSQFISLIILAIGAAMFFIKELLWDKKE